MSERRTNSRIIVQGDFDAAFRDGDKAWVTFKECGQPNIYGELEPIRKNQQTGEVQVRATGNFAVNECIKNTISLSYKENEDKTHECTFQAPDVNFTSVHPHKISVNCLDVSNGGLAVSSDTQSNTMKIWTTEDGSVRRELSGHVSDITVCRFFPSGVVVLSGSSDMRLKVWSAETGQCAATFVGHKGGITAVDMIERGRNIVSSSRDGTAKLWDCGTQKCLYSWENLDCGHINACSIGVPPDSMELGLHTTQPVEHESGTEGKVLLVAGENNSLQGYSLRSRDKVFSLLTDSPANCCCFVSENIVVTGTDNGTMYGVDLRNPSEPMAEVKESRGAILSFCPHKDGFWTSTADGSCFYITEQLNTDRELVGPDSDPVYRVVADQRYIYTACRDGGIRKYRMR